MICSGVRASGAGRVFRRRRTVRASESLSAGLRRLDVRERLAFDRHFAERGFVSPAFD